jgi:hypothetical protein
MASMLGSSAHIEDSAGLAPTRSPAATNSRSLSSLRKAAIAPPSRSMPPAWMVCFSALPAGV